MGKNLNLKLHPAVFWPLTIISAMAVWAYMGSGLILNVVRAQDFVTPANLRVPFEEVSFYSSGRKLAGWFIPSSDKNSRSTIIICHGWGASKGDVLPSTVFLRKRHNLLYFDLTAHGESGGSKISMGKYESEDVASAANFLREKYPHAATAMGVYGFSLGASAAIVAAARDGNITAVAAESPFYSYNEITSRHARHFLKLPPWPFASLARLAARARLGHNPEDYSPRHFVAAISPRPVLFIASAGDENIPPSVTKKLFEAAGEPKSLKIFDARGHGAARAENPREYAALLDDFFARSLKPPATSLKSAANK